MDEKEKLRILKEILSHAVSPSTYGRIPADLYHEAKPLLRKLGVVSKGYRSHGADVALGLGPRFSRKHFEDYVISELRRVFLEEKKMAYDEYAHEVLRLACVYSLWFGQRFEEMFDTCLEIMFGENPKRHGFKIYCEKDSLTGKPDKIILWRRYGEGLFNILLCRTMEALGDYVLSAFYVGKLNGKPFTGKELKQFLKDPEVFLKRGKVMYAEIYYLDEIYPDLRKKGIDNILSVAYKKYKIICREYSELIEKIRQLRLVSRKRGWKFHLKASHSERRVFPSEFTITLENPQNGGKVALTFSGLSYDDPEICNASGTYIGEVIERQTLRIDKLIKILSDDNIEYDGNDIADFFIRLSAKYYLFRHDPVRKAAVFTRLSLENGLEGKYEDLFIIQKTSDNKALNQFVVKYSNFLRDKNVSKIITKALIKTSSVLYLRTIAEMLPDRILSIYLLKSRKDLSDEEVKIIESSLLSGRSDYRKILVGCIFDYLGEKWDERLCQTLVKYIAEKATRLEALRLFDETIRDRLRSSPAPPSNNIRNFFEIFLEKCFNLRDVKVLDYDLQHLKILSSIEGGKFLARTEIYPYSGLTMIISPSSELFKDCRIKLELPLGKSLNKNNMRKVDTFLPKGLEYLENVKRVYDEIIVNVPTFLLKLGYLSGRYEKITPRTEVVFDVNFSTTEGLDERFQWYLERVKRELEDRLSKLFNLRRKMTV